MLNVNWKARFAFDRYLVSPFCSTQVSMDSSPRSQRSDPQPMDAVCWNRFLCKVKCLVNDRSQVHCAHHLQAFSERSQPHCWSSLEISADTSELLQGRDRKQIPWKVRFPYQQKHCFQFIFFPQQSFIESKFTRYIKCYQVSWKHNPEFLHCQ